MHTSMMMTVNSPPVPHRDISGASTTSYRPYNEEYTVQHHLDRPLQTEVDAEKSKKDKKWSIGKLFRRKKKEEDSGTSSQSEDGNRSPSKRKSKTKKRAPAVNNFDHIVVRDTRRAQSLANSNIRDAADDGILSDPSAGFIKYKGDNHETYSVSKESIQYDTSRSGKGIFEIPTRKKRKSRVKARVEALRNSMKGESSSDEESLKSSSNSSSIIRFRSEDSLMRSRDSSLNKRSKSARNERYIKRLSRDEENQLNKEAELLQQGYTKAEVEMLTRTPTSQSSGYGTCKRENTSKVITEPPMNDTNRRPLKSESVSSFPSTQSYPSSINFNAKVNNERINYSIQYPNNNTNRTSIYNSNRESSVSNQYETPDSIICVKFPLGNVSNIKKEERSPPVPPPRDMHRKVVTPLSMYYENSPTVVERNINQNSNRGVPNNDFERIMRRSQERLVNYGLNGLRRPISNSEDHIAMQDNENIQSYTLKSEQPRRPASVSAEPNHYGLYMNSPPWKKQTVQNNIIKPEPIQLKQNYLYYADQSPRSRRPISIKTSQSSYQNQYLSDSQVSREIHDKTYQRPRNASEFWKKIDDAEKQRKQQHLFSHSRSNSEYSGSSQMSRTFQSNEPKNSTWKNREISQIIDTSSKSKSVDIIDGAKVWKATTEYKRSTTVEPGSTATSDTKTHIRHKSDTQVSGTYQAPSDDEKSSERRKSTNLDDALNELEAIYNSLGLGDEDLLDRAERRELMTPKFYDNFNDWNGNDGDTHLRSQPATPLRRISRRSTLPDKLQDDMAFRRMNSFSNKEKPNNKDAQAQISYMLASPVYVPYASDDDRQSERNEPDVVFDDVVYRNIKQTNNRLKTIDPQPPFGIPVGPVSPAPQSDYLHATPENKGRSRFVPKKSPDIVADDLAYRSLRKDHRHSSLFNGENYNGYVNNNGYAEFPFSKDSAANIKKKRAVRSLSANIFSMIQKEIDDALNMSRIPPLQKTHSNSDVMKRLRETFEKNDNQKELYPRNKVKQRHNTVNLFANSTSSLSHHFAKDDSFIHSDDICLAKSSSCDKSKCSSPSNRSPQASKGSSKDDFQQVLSLLAQEAMDTSNKLGVALAELDKNRNKNEVSDIQSRISDSRASFLNGLTEKTFDDTLTELSKAENTEETVQEKSHLSTDGSSKAKNTEDSLLLISDQLHKVEDQLKHNFEKDVKLIETNSKPARKFKEPSEKKYQKLGTPVASHCNVSSIPDIKTHLFEPNEHEIANENKMEKCTQRFHSLNPFLSTDDKVHEISEIKAFRELKDGISDLIAGITDVNEKCIDSESSKTEKAQQANDLHLSKYDCEIQNDLKSNLSNRVSASLSVYEDDLDAKKDVDSTEYNSSEELATIFKLDCNDKKPSNNDIKTNNDNEKRNDLNSPKIVKSLNQHLRRLSVDESSSQSSSLPNTIVPWRAKRQNSTQNEKKGDNTKSKRNWHDNGTLMLACSYTLMFSQHLADLDWLTLLGLLLAMITIVAMLII